MNKETKADEFRVGDIVWCILRGKGEVYWVDSPDENNAYPVEVKFDVGFTWYTPDGKFVKDGPRALFFSEPKIEAAVTRPFVPTLVGKTVVIEHRFAGNIIGEITAESETLVWLGSNKYSKCNSIAIYEVSSENLLVDAASGKTALK